MSRMKITHHTAFRYAGAVGASYNEARMLPSSDDGQLVLQSRLRVHPVGSVHEYVDYWGTRVASFDVLQEHTELMLTSECIVELWHAEHLEHTSGWEEFSELTASRTAYIEQLEQSRRTDPPTEVVELARMIAAEAADPCSAAQAISEAIGERMEYVQGVTGVNSTASEAWAVGKGVCQDITHVALGALRAVGIPARYVSGYLHPSPAPIVGEKTAGESHAWVEWFCGQSWRGFDPTNLADITDRHVAVARGRDYDDVAPLRGVYSGDFTSTLDVSVEITRIG